MIRKYDHLMSRVQVDPLDRHWLDGHTWHIRADRPGLFYVTVRTATFVGDLHRLVLGSPDEKVDHINGDGLDNRRSNLRTATTAQNAANQRPQMGRSSRYKGVDWKPSHNSWRVRIKTGGRSRHIGYFSTEEAAAEAYNEAALQAFDQFARLNKVA